MRHMRAPPRRALAMSRVLGATLGMCSAGGTDAGHEGTTKTGAPKEHFGSGHGARVEAGKKGGHISVRTRALHPQM